MAEAIILCGQSSFTGGIGRNTKTGPENSCQFSQNLDIFFDKDSVRMNPAAVKDSGSVVQDLVLWGTSAQPWSTDLYFYGGNHIYKRTSGGTWSIDHTINTGNAAAQGLVAYLDGLYYATSTTIGRKYLLDNNPIYNDDFISDGLNNLDATNVASGQSYILPTSIFEDLADRFTFDPVQPSPPPTSKSLTKDPIKEIDVLMNAKGTGNWTLTLHDSFNNVLSTVTILNANLASVGYTAFVFPTPIRINRGGSYHFHLTSSDGTGSVVTNTSGDLSTAGVNEYFGILIGSVPYHPLFCFTQGTTPTLLVGNESYVGTFTASGYNPNAAALEAGFVVRGFTIDQGYLVIVADRGTDVSSYQEGRLYYWDVVGPNYNFVVPITIGVPNAAQSFKKRPFFVAGNRGDLYLTSSASDTDRRIQPLPKLTYGNTIEVKPGAMDVWQNIMRIGYGASGTDSSFPVGVWDFGSQSDRAIDWQQASIEVLNYGFTISTGTTDSTKAQIGNITALGQDMYVSWFDSSQNPGSQYGVDRINKSNNPANIGVWESLVEDRGVDKTGQIQHMPQKAKHCDGIMVTYLPLPSGCTVTPKYRLDRATTFVLDPQPGNTTGSRATYFPVNLDYHELEFGFNLSVSGSVSPVITGIFAICNLRVSEGLEDAAI